MDQHTHCQICGKPIPLDEQFCSQKCREEYENLINKRKKRMYILYGLLAVFFVVMFFSLSGYW